MVYSAQKSPAFNLNNFGLSQFHCSAKIIMVAALWPVMKVAEVTSESHTGGCVMLISAWKRYNNVIIMPNTFRVNSMKTKS